MKRMVSSAGSAAGALALVTSLAFSAHAICGDEVHQAGISGGSGGSSFTSSVGRLTEVIVNSGQYVDGITLVYQGGYWQHFGGSGGNPHEVFIEPGVTAVGIAGRCGEYVDSIELILSNGQQTPLYGGNGGKLTYSYVVPNGCELVGLIGRCGQYIDAIGIQYQ